jgi:hypothetical protein
MSATWEQAREEWSKATQMGWQSIQEFAIVGRILIELKEDKEQTPHGTWGPKLATLLNMETRAAANTLASRLMRIAKHMPMLELKKPQNMNSALALIKKETQMDKPKMVGWTKAAEIELGSLPAGFSRNTLAQDQKKKDDISAMCGFPVGGRIEIGGEKAKAIAKAIETLACRYDSEKAIAERAAEAAAAAESLPKTAKEKLEAAARKMERELAARFDTEVEARVSPLREKLQREYVTQAEETERLRQVRAGIRGMLTRDEFNLIRTCLHPDKQPEDKRDRYNRAFEIFNRLETAVNDKPATRTAPAGQSFADMKKAASARGIH